MKELKFFIIELRSLTYYYYLEQKTYYHNNVTAPSPQTISFFDLLQPPVLLLVTLRLHSKVLDLLKVLYPTIEITIKFLMQILILIALCVCMKVNTSLILQKIQHITQQRPQRAFGYKTLYLQKRHKLHSNLSLNSLENPPLGYLMMSFKYQKKRIAI